MTLLKRVLNTLLISNNSIDTNSKKNPQIIYLSEKITGKKDKKAIRKIAQTISDGKLVVIDFGATYGTAFKADIVTRREVAIKRNETKPFATVSLVSTLQYISTLIDRSKLHPVIVAMNLKGLNSAFENIAFIRFPITPEASEKLGSDFVNKDGEVQVFLVPQNEPLLKELRNRHRIYYYAVRSSNTAGEPENPDFSGALVYAQKIDSSMLVVGSREGSQKEQIRKSSQPIVCLPLNIVEDGAKIRIPIFKITRAGNTHPKLLERWIKHNFPSVHVVYEEEKIVSQNITDRRKLFTSDVPSEQLGEIFLRASNLI
ncbi:hypothetical protein ACFL1P_00410 [Patescibacteria group bacterium]